MRQKQVENRSGLQCALSTKVCEHLSPALISVSESLTSKHEGRVESRPTHLPVRVDLLV